MLRRVVLLMSSLALAAAEAAAPDTPIGPDAEAPPVEDAQPAEASKKKGRINLKVDPDAYSIVSTVRGLSSHRPMFIYPVSYSAEYNDQETEVIFQISVKQRLLRLFNNNLYFGYTQKSFWQMYNSGESSPFRETNYAPEIFYRFVPDPERFNHWGLDAGFEHESNGREFPDSRSWNRVYLAPFQAKGRQLAYLRFWYRIPEGEPATVDNIRGDDNPDIHRYMGYSELSLSRQIGGGQLLTGMARGNVRTGRGALSLTWSTPSDEGHVFYGVSVFHGYGESLIEYDESITRLMLGIMLSR